MFDDLMIICEGEAVSYRLASEEQKRSYYIAARDGRGEGVSIAVAVYGKKHADMTGEEMREYARIKSAVYSFEHRNELSAKKTPTFCERVFGKKYCELNGREIREYERIKTRERRGLSWELWEHEKRGRKKGSTVSAHKKSASYILFGKKVCELTDEERKQYNAILKRAHECEEV